MTADATALHDDDARWRASLLLLTCGALIVAISLGIRHGFGLFIPLTVQATGWERGTLGLAFAIQNIVWGAATPFAGMIGDRIGSGKVIVVGAVFYAAGLYFMATPTSPEFYMLSAGVLVGLGLAGTCFPIVFGAVSRAMPLSRRSMAMGIVMAVGSFGQFAMVPVEHSMIEGIGWNGQQVIAGLNWDGALVALAVVAACMIPLALPLFEKGDTLKAEPGPGVVAALGEAFSSRDYWLLTIGFFSCGFQVVFIALYLPDYLGREGIGPAVATTTLALIGLVNIFGAYSAGALGGRRAKPPLLAWIYLGRAIVIAAFVLAPKTPMVCYAFGAAMGLFWLSTVPLTNGIVATIFGVKNMSMLGGIVFFSHQIGSFLGSWLGGVIFDETGSYDLAWALAIGISIMSALVNLPIREVPLVRGDYAEAAR